MLLTAYFLPQKWNKKPTRKGLEEDIHEAPYGKGDYGSPNDIVLDPVYSTEDPKEKESERKTKTNKSDNVEDDVQLPHLRRVSRLLLTIDVDIPG